MRAMLGMLVVLAATVHAHGPTPEDLVAALTTPAARVAAGIERAERDVRNPRLLVVRVGPAWFAQPRDARATAASQWYASWRRAVPQGVVGVVDGRTDRVVVRFGRGGAVVEVRDRPG